MRQNLLFLYTWLCLLGLACVMLAPVAVPAFTALHKVAISEIWPH